MKIEAKITDDAEYAEYYKVRINNVGHFPYFVKDQWMEDFKNNNSNDR